MPRLPQSPAGLVHGPKDRLQIRAGRHFEIYHSVDIIFRVIDHAFDLAVGNDVKLAVTVANLREPNADGLDYAVGVADLHVIADQILVLEENEESRNQIGDQALRSQPHGQASRKAARISGLDRWPSANRSPTRMARRKPRWSVAEPTSPLPRAPTR